MKSINYQETLLNIRSILRNYITKNQLKSLVLGVSGGADSALVAAIAYPVCKELGIPLIGRSITIETNKLDERLRAIQIGKHFCTDFDEVDLTDEFLVMMNILSRSCDKLTHTEMEREIKIRLGNVKARLRMMYLYDLAQKNKGLVLSTDNYTELMVGFWTLHGDVGDYGMIQELWKTEVYGMIEWMSDNELTGEASEALKSMLDAVATDGLGITKSDLDQLLPDWRDRHTTTRQGYKEVDDILDVFLTKLSLDYLNFDTNPITESDKSHPVIQRHLRTEFKRQNPLNLKRKDIVVEL